MKKYKLYRLLQLLFLGSNSTHTHKQTERGGRERTITDTKIKKMNSAKKNIKRKNAGKRKTSLLSPFITF